LSGAAEFTFQHLVEHRFNPNSPANRAFRKPTHNEHRQEQSDHSIQMTMARDNPLANKPAGYGRNKALTFADGM
jgi:hypothetical protein